MDKTVPNHSSIKPIVQLTRTVYPETQVETYTPSQDQDGNNSPDHSESSECKYPTSPTCPGRIRSKLSHAVLFADKVLGLFQDDDRSLYGHSFYDPWYLKAPSITEAQHYFRPPEQTMCSVNSLPTESDCVNDDVEKCLLPQSVVQSALEEGDLSGSPVPVIFKQADVDHFNLSTESDADLEEESFSPASVYYDCLEDIDLRSPGWLTDFECGEDKGEPTLVHLFSPDHPISMQNTAESLTDTTTKIDTSIRPVETGVGLNLELDTEDYPALTSFWEEFVFQKVLANLITSPCSGEAFEFPDLYPNFTTYPGSLQVSKVVTSQTTVIDSRDARNTFNKPTEFTGGTEQPSEIGPRDVALETCREPVDLTNVIRDPNKSESVSLSVFNMATTEQNETQGETQFELTSVISDACEMNGQDLRSFTTETSLHGVESAENLTVSSINLKLTNMDEQHRDKLQCEDVASFTTVSLDPTKLVYLPSSKETESKFLLKKSHQLVTNVFEEKQDESNILPTTEFTQCLENLVHNTSHSEVSEKSEKSRLLQEYGGTARSSWEEPWPSDEEKKSEVEHALPVTWHVFEVPIEPQWSFSPETEAGGVFKVPFPPTKSASLGKPVHEREFEFFPAPFERVEMPAKKHHQYDPAQFNGLGTTFQDSQPLTPSWSSFQVSPEPPVPAMAIFKESEHVYDYGTELPTQLDYPAKMSSGSTMKLPTSAKTHRQETGTPLSQMTDTHLEFEQESEILNQPSSSDGPTQNIHMSQPPTPTLAENSIRAQEETNQCSEPLDDTPSQLWKTFEVTPEPFLAQAKEKKDVLSGRSQNPMEVSQVANVRPSSSMATDFTCGPIHCREDQSQYGYRFIATLNQDSSQHSDTAKLKDLNTPPDAIYVCGCHLNPDENDTCLSVLNKANQSQPGQALIKLTTWPNQIDESHITTPSPVSEVTDAAPVRPAVGKWSFGQYNQCVDAEDRNYNDYKRNLSTICFKRRSVVQCNSSLFFNPLQSTPIFCHPKESDSSLFCSLWYTTDGLPPTLSGPPFCASDCGNYVNDHSSRSSHAVHSPDEGSNAGLLITTVVTLDSDKKGWQHEEIKTMRKSLQSTKPHISSDQEDEDEPLRKRKRKRIRKASSDSD